LDHNVKGLSHLPCVSPWILILPVNDRHFRAYYALKPINKRPKIKDFGVGLLQMFQLQQPLYFNNHWGREISNASSAQHLKLFIPQS